MARSSRITTVGGVGGGDLRAAAEVIAGTARELAAWSVRIPAEIHVDVAGDTAEIWCESPPAYPNEVPDVWHPTFGHKPEVLNKHRPFLGPAADARAGAAMARYADKIDRMCRKAGFS